MKVINKQKFLAELGRLLTFMYEEDRLETLALYEDLFDAASDEQALLQLLVSPTRQAVVLARSYQSGNGKLQVRSSPHVDEVSEDDTPAHIIAIYELRHSAELMGLLAPVVDDNQISIFDDAPEAKPENSEAPESAEEVSAVGETAAPAESAAPVPPDAAENDESPAPDETAPVSDAETVSEAEPAPEAETAENVDEVSDAVESFLAGFSIEGAELAAEPETVPAPAEAPAEAPAADPIKDDFSAPLDEGKPVRKLSPLLLILYLIPAIPVGVAVTALLLVPAAVFLALGAGVIGAGVLLLISAFGSFAMLSDILVVLGMALVVLAFGILFAWLFVWFIGVPIVGFIRALCSLGRKWCSKEVAA